MVRDQGACGQQPSLPSTSVWSRVNSTPSHARVTLGATVQILEKASIVRRQSYDEVMREMVLLRDLRHPFICNVNYAFQASAPRNLVRLSHGHAFNLPPCIADDARTKSTCTS